MSDAVMPARPLDNGRFYQLLSSFLAAAVLLALGLFVGQIALDYFRDASRFPIHSVVVEGDYQHTDQQALRERVLTQAQRGFFNLDIAGIQRRVQDLPWVDKAYVRRIWPDGISVTIEEHQPVARWNDHGLISADYDLFEPPALNQNNSAGSSERLWMALGQLPALRSPQRRHVAMLRLLNEVQPILDRANVPILGISEDLRRSVTLQLRGGVEVIIGHRRILERVNRFAAVFQSHIARQYDAISRVDMRHTNGFAMARKPGGAEPKSRTE